MRARASSTAACERDLEPTPHLAACALCRTKHEVTTTWCMRTRGVYLVSTVARRAHERAKGRAMAHDGTAWWTRKDSARPVGKYDDDGDDGNDGDESTEC